MVVVYLAQRSFVFGNIFLPFLDPFVHSKQGYIFYPLMTIAIPYLFLLSKDSKIDRTIGNLSFSVYLLGTTITSHIVRLNLQYNDLNWLKHFLVLSITIIVAGGIYKFIEKPIEVLRSKRVEKNINGT